LSSFPALFINREDDFFNRLHDLKNRLRDSAGMPHPSFQFQFQFCFHRLCRMGKCNKKSYIIIYNNIKIIFTIFIGVMSGEFQTEIEMGKLF